MARACLHPTRAAQVPLGRVRNIALFAVRASMVRRILIMEQNDKRYESVKKLILAGGNED